jgi:SAM-dependent methyltransferase
MEDFTLLIDLHRQGWRQGPGGDAETEHAVRLAGLDGNQPLEVADLGCGTGASTLALARLLNARITAVDMLPEFLEVLAERAGSRGVADRVTTLTGSMEDLPFGDHSLDVIWCEGAIYNIGFEKGISCWRRLLRPGGLLVVSEITWLTETRPAALERHWNNEYPQIALASTKMNMLEHRGYAPLGYFVLSERCWLEEYYRPMQARFDDFLARHGNSAEAHKIVAAEQREIVLYERYRSFFGYGMYVARKPVA